MILELCPTKKTHCSICLKAVAKGTLRVTRKRYYNSTLYFHLDCFRPEHIAPVKIDLFYFKNVTETKDVDEVKRWVETWNRQFITNEDSVPAEFLKKAVSTVSTHARRRLIETFSFLSIRDIETIAALVCKDWFHISRDEELWKSRFIIDFHPSGTESEANYRRKYIAYCLGACFGCKSVISSDMIARKCLLYNRLICKRCSSLPEFEIVSIHSFCESRHVTQSTLRMLEVPEFEFKKVKSIYLSTAVAKMIPYGQRRMQLLIATLSEKYSDRIRPEELTQLKNVNVEMHYEGGVGAHRTKTLVTYHGFVFCGKNERGERLDKNIEVFLEKVENFRKPAVMQLP